MISFLRGRLAALSPTEAVIDVQGVGYRVNIPLSTFGQLERSGHEVTVLTHMHVREDALQLFGFASEAEREMFRLLISVSGIGPRMAQGILSGLSTAELKNALLQGSIPVLTSISGVGRKTAERLVVELRDKVGKLEPVPQGAAGGGKEMKVRAEATIALMSLGYSRPSAERAIDTVMRSGADAELPVEDLIKQALHHASR